VEDCRTGYPNLAAFLDSDESFMIYRRFGYIASRLLLEKQDEMRQLEEELDMLDRHDETNHPDRIQTRDLIDEDANPRRTLLKTIEEKFCEYGKNSLNAA
jgi:hypothetical protein